MNMTEIEQKYAIAALTVFTRYGPRKATMEEIASEANVSKPTLYGTFRNKDAAMAAVIRLTKSTAVETVRVAWQNADNLDQKLDLFFEHLVIAVHEKLHSMPDAAAFYNAIGDTSTEAIREAFKWETALLESALAMCSLNDTTPERYANFIVIATTHAKLQSPSREELLAFLAELKLSVLAMAK